MQITAPHPPERQSFLISRLVRARRVEEYCGPVQVADLAQNLSGILSAPVSLLVALHLAEHFSRRLGRDYTARSGPAFLRVGPACCCCQRSGRARALSRTDLVPDHSVAHSVPWPLLLRLDLPHGHLAAFRRRPALRIQARQAAHRFQPLQALANRQICRAHRRPGRCLFRFRGPRLARSLQSPNSLLRPVDPARFQLRRPRHPLAA